MIFEFKHFSESILYQNKKDDENREPHLDYVLDITIAYPEKENPIDLPTIVFGTRPASQTHFLYRLYHSSEVCFPILSPSFLFINRVIINNQFD